jgi:hypothetical protein
MQIEQAEKAASSDTKCATSTFSAELFIKQILKTEI